jgi:hypothetical protein
MHARLGLLALALAATLAPATAQARVLVGIGDQKPAMFADPRFSWLGIKHARIVVSWEVEQVAWERAQVDEWLNQAHAQGVEPLVGFGHSWPDERRRILPSVASYRKAVADFHAKYPWVNDYIAWNEANHCSQPTCHHPTRAAAYYDAMVDTCPTCNVVAADVLDQNSAPKWLKAFRRAVRHRPKIWGLHNYVDVNRLRSSGTRRVLRAVPGAVWITETGGLVRRKHYRNRIEFPESASHAGQVTKYALRLASALPRVERLYLYQWNSLSPEDVWDSGLIGPSGRTRPGFAALARFLGRNPLQAPLPIRIPGPPPGRPVGPIAG